jgi:hypothetical protein
VTPQLREDLSLTLTSVSTIATADRSSPVARRWPNQMSVFLRHPTAKPRAVIVYPNFDFIEDALMHPRYKGRSGVYHHVSDHLHEHGCWILQQRLHVLQEHRGIPAVSEAVIDRD